MSESSSSKELWSCMGSVLAAIIMGTVSLIIAGRIPFPDLNKPTETPTPVSYIEITNHLFLSVNIQIDGVERGGVESGQTTQFSIDRYPAYVHFSVEKQTSADGNPIGDEMTGHWDSVEKETHLDITNVIGDSFFFYPLIHNNTDLNCQIHVNDGYSSEIIPGWVNSKSTAAAGYYRYYSDSNVTLYCWGDDRFVYWGIHPTDTDSGTGLYVDSNSGLCDLTYNP